MKILIVDDDHYSVKAIRERVDWNSLADQKIEVFSAYNGAQARELIRKEEVDIMICDIEMPRESGIELIRWIRKEQLAVEVIIITCYAEFQYAKDAISLDVYDYCVKPLDFVQMGHIVRTLIGKIERLKAEQLKSRYGDYWIENRTYMERSFWEKALTGAFRKKEDQMLQEAGKIGIARLEDAELNLVLIYMKRFQIRLAKWNEEKIYHAIINVAREILDGNMGSERVFRMGVAIIAIIRDREEEWIKEKCREMANVCQELLKVRLCCYIGKKVRYDELDIGYDSLCRRTFEDVSHAEGVFCEAPKERAAQMERVEIPGHILEKLELGQLDGILVKIHMWLAEMEQEGKVCREMLGNLRENFLQAVYHHLMKLGIPAAVLSDEMIDQAYYNSGDSTECMEEWIHLVIVKTQKEQQKLEEKNGTGHGAVRQMKAYMEEHLAEELSREQIAGAVYLNPDYAARIFKKAESDSMMEYLTKRRIAKAVQLMCTTQMSIGDIAVSTGFVNISHFSTAFKKVMGVAPNQYRKQNK